MPTFKAIGYCDRDAYDRTDAAVRDNAHDEPLRAIGARRGVAASPLQVRNYDAAGTETTEVPFLRSSLPVAGFAVIEAASLVEALDLAARRPCAVAYGAVEGWPLDDAPEPTGD